MSVVTLAELRHGVQGLADGHRRRRLEAWLREDLALRFEGRLLPIDQPVIDRWGELVAAREAAGRPIGVMDAFIAATANVHQLELVTRNEADFRSTVQEIVNPWAIRA